MQGYLEKSDDNGARREEVKTVAHIFAFKIIDLHLRKSKRSEAVDVFRGHLQFFKNYTSQKEIEFRYPAWFAQQ